MNILFFLTPKSEVAFLYDDQTLRQALEIMEHHRYTAVPMINKHGKYIGTITEGDLLWGIKNEYNLSLRDAEHVPVATIPRRIDNAPVSIDATMVVDDQENFIGIITRKDIIRYCYDQMRRTG